MISVCIATYNGGKYISKQLQSILIQLGENDEVVISDDASIDDTLDVIRAFNDSRIKILPSQRFNSPIRNFENAINNAAGDVIFLSDQDDIWHPEKVVKMTAVLNHSEIVVCDCSIINEKDQVILKSFFSSMHSSPGVIHNFKKNTYLGCCMAFNRKITTKILPFPKDIPMHDIWIGFVCDIFFKSTFLKEQLTYYRKHDNNASTTAKLRSDASFIRKVMNRYNLLKYVPKLLLR